jgi:hypothetical protein
MRAVDTSTTAGDDEQQKRVAMRAATERAAMAMATVTRVAGEGRRRWRRRGRGRQGRW